MLILEEINVSSDFSSWFYSKVMSESPAPKLIGAWHSVVDGDLGESDLVAIYENGHAILIENKIDAVEQPQQAERYRLRGEKGVVDKKWKLFTTCMIAPEEYLQKVTGYDSTICYEDLVGWFGSIGDRRSMWRKYILQEAIEQNRRGHNPETDINVTKFWTNYWQYATANHPELGMQKPDKKPSQASFIYFKPSLPNGLSLVHKLDKSAVDLQIAGMAGRVDEFSDIFADLDVEVVTTGKSAAFRRMVPLIDHTASFESQKDIVEEALVKAEELLSILAEVAEQV